VKESFIKGEFLLILFRRVIFLGLSVNEYLFSEEILVMSFVGVVILKFFLVESPDFELCRINSYH